MGTGSGGNWKLTIRREERGVVLLQAVTCDRRAVLPEQVQGLPVIGVGNHALSPTGSPAEGKRSSWAAGIRRTGATGA